jgi:two-component system, cell cycle sensor histidine kinase and response regulator CckA
VKNLLLVDDEPALLELLKKYLERLGYQVDAYLTAEDALVQFDADPARYALVLTDLTLPGLGGDEMLDRMRTSRPGLRAIISSGYPYVPRSKKILFLQKPYVPKMLAGMIETLIGPA